MSIAFHPRVWLNLINSPLYPVEEKALVAAANSETGLYRRQIEDQIHAINFVQRHAGGREVYFYRVVGGIVRTSLGAQIDLSQREFLWAEVEIHCSDGLSFSGEIWLLNGRVGCLIFNKDVGPRQLTNEASVELKRLNSVSRTAVIPLAWIDRLPSDLRELAADTGRGSPNLVFVQPEETYEVTLSQGKFIVIGELIDNGTILFPSPDNSSFSGVYFGSYDGSPVRFLGENCLSAKAKLGQREGRCDKPQ